MLVFVVVIELVLLVVADELIVILPVVDFVDDIVDVIVGFVVPEMVVDSEDVEDGNPEDVDERVGFSVDVVVIVLEDEDESELDGELVGFGLEEIVEDVLCDGELLIEPEFVEEPEIDPD